jgi:hypothetical protein
VQEDGQRQSLDDNADVRGNGQALQADTVKEERIDGDGDEGDDPSGGCGRDGVAGGVKRAGIDSLGGPEGDGESEESEVDRSGVRIGWGEGAVAEEIDDGRGESDHPGTKEKGRGEDAGDGAVDGGSEVVEAVLTEECGEEGERGCSGGLAEDAHGGGEESSGYGQEGDATGVVRGEIAGDPLVGCDERDADHEGEGEAKPFEEGRVAEVEDGLIVEAVAQCSVEREGGGAQNDSREDADGEGVDTEALMQEDCSEDDAEVVDQRCDGGVDEDLADKQAGAHDSAEEEEELGRKQDAGERGAEGGLLGVEPAKGDTCVERSEDFGEKDTNGEDDGHGVEDDREGTVCAGFVSLGAVAVEDGDHGDRDDASDEEVGEHVGELEGCVVGVGGGACSEDAVDVPGANES